MKKDDYRSEFEEHRQEIKLDEEPTVIKTRAELYKNTRKPKKKSRNVMINVIFALFTLIPVIIIAFFIINWYLDSDNNTTAAQDSRVKYETSANKTKQEENNSVKNDEKAEKEAKAKAEEEAKAKAEEEAKAKAEEEEAKAKAEEEAKAKAEEEAKAKAEEEAKAKAEEEPNPAIKTHTVAAGETIYSISVTHYQSGSGVNKIKQANGLTSNEIYVGQVLMIP